MSKSNHEDTNDSDLSEVGHGTTAVDFYERGLAFFECGELENALAAFDEALQIEPLMAQAHNGRGAVLLPRGEFDSAMAEFNESIRLDPCFCKPYVNRGLAYHSLGEYERALADFNEAIRLDSDFGAAFEGRGHCLFDMHQYEEAIEDYSRCIQLNSQTAKAFAMRGLAFMYLEEPEESLSNFDESIQLDSTSAWVFNCRASAYHRIDDYESAFKDYDEAIRLEPDYANAYLNRGQAFHGTEQFDRSISDFDKSISLDPKKSDSFYYRAKTWWEKGELKKAVDDLTEAIRLDPTHWKACQRRAQIWNDLGQHEKAEQDLERADVLEAAKSSEGNTMRNRKKEIYQLLEKHFLPAAFDDITITERRFPSRVRADLQRAIESLVQEQSQLVHFCGVRKQYHHEGINFSELIIQDRRDPAISVPPQYEEVDIGEEQTVMCLKDGLWLLEHDGQKFALFLEPPSHMGRKEGIRIQIATVNDTSGTEISKAFFKRLEKAMFESTCYRGKTLSLQLNNPYSGVSTGITVHNLKGILRDQVILPRKTLELLERNVIRFVAQRPRLDELGISTKKGLLFYGPPGTGKTHTIHFLIGTLEGHTTFLISAEQVGLLGEYMTLARLLQPSIVVIEDVDLIARDRMEMSSACEEVLLNKLLNEMDGLQQDADILFILTTNRPEALETALASRPGRIDQAIEFPLPDDEGRAKLIRLYSYGVTVSNAVVENTVKKTAEVSAAFIKELMRRAMQFHLERADSSTIEMQDVDNAIEELLFSGGTLNRKLLGAKIDE